MHLFVILSFRFCVTENTSSRLFVGSMTGGSSLLTAANVNFMLQLRQKELEMKQAASEVAILNALGTLPPK